MRITSGFEKGDVVRLTFDVRIEDEMYGRPTVISILDAGIEVAELILTEGLLHAAQFERIPDG